MVTEIIKNYQFLVNNLGKMIEVSGYRNDFIAEKIGVKPSNFSVKKQKGNWTLEEVGKLMNVIENNYVTEYLDAQMIQASYTGNIITSI